MNFFQRVKQDSKFLLLLLMLLAFIVAVIFAIVVGFVFWFWIILTISVLFFLGFFRIYQRFGCYLALIIYCIIIFFSLYLVFSHDDKASTSKTASTSTPKLSADECKPLFEKYNNKILKISGDSTVGSIGIKMTSDCTFSARYIITFNGALPQNPIQDIAISNNYNYVNNLHKSTETARGHYGIGALSLVNQNALTLPSPYATAQEISAFYRNQADQSVINNATSFYWSYEKTGNFSMTKYQEMLDNSVFEVVDGLPYMEKTTYGDNTVSYSIDQERAEKEGTIVKTIKLTITE